MSVYDSEEGDQDDDRDVKVYIVRGEHPSGPDVAALEAPAAKWDDDILVLFVEGPYSEGREAQGSLFLKELRAYLTARPASDLERRLREQAEREHDDGSSEVGALLFEGADALANRRDWQRVANYIDKDNTRLRLHTADLERELAEAKASAERDVSTMFDRAEAAEARLAAVAKLADDWKGGRSEPAPFDDADNTRHACADMLLEALAAPQVECCAWGVETGADSAAP